MQLRVIDGGRMANGDDTSETPVAFLKRLGEGLKGSEEVDRDVAAIIATHILQGAPAPNAVTLAKDAFLKLAEKRAMSQSAEAANGCPNVP
jgi:hypothetical protein